MKNKTIVLYTNFELSADLPPNFADVSQDTFLKKSYPDR